MTPEQEIEQHAEAMAKKYRREDWVLCNCISCHALNCVYNRSCVKCDRTFAFFRKGTKDGNNDWMLTISILDE